MWLSKQTVQFFIFATLLFFAGDHAFAAPNIISQNLTGVGTFTPGQTITFSANTTNVGDGMTTNNSHRLRQVRTLTAQGGVFDYAIKGNYLYTFGYSSGRQIHIYNISNPEAPVLENTYTIPSSGTSYVYEIEVYGNYLVLGGNNVKDSYEVAIVDISNPTNPVYVSFINTQVTNGWVSGVGPLYDCKLNDIEGMKVVGNKLYVAGGAANSTGYTENFCAFDISNPASPIFNSDVNNDGFTGPFDIQGNYAYLLITPTPNTTFRGIRIIDISNPSNMTIVGQVALSNVGAATASHDLKVEGNYAYVGGSGSGDLQIINISNPAAPQFISQLDYSTLNTNWVSGTGASLHYPYLYLANPSGMTGINVIDVSNPANPVIKGHVDGSVSDITGTNSNYVFGSGSSASSLSIYKPMVRARFCIDNPSCLSSTGGGIKTTTMDPLASGATVATSTTWVATLGTHTIYYCSDIIEQYSFDGVSESNESDNCSSYTFVVSNPPPPVVTVEVQVNGGAWSGANVTVDPTDVLAIRWSSTNGTSCTGSGSGFSTGGVISGTDTSITTPTPGTTGTYAVSCNGPGGSGSDILSVTVRQRPNFTTPIFSTPAFGTFDGVSGTYNNMTITMQTSNNGGSGTLVTAGYEISVNGVVRSTGSVAALGAGGFFNQVLTIPGPIPIGSVTVQAEIDDTNQVTESNESDNVGQANLTVPSADPGLSITAQPSQVQHSSNVTLSWSVGNPYPMSCSVFGPGMTTVNFDPSASASGNVQVGPINAKSIYTIACTAGGVNYSRTATVETQGVIEEV